MGAMQDKSEKTARRLWFPEVIILLLFLVGTYLATDIQDHLGINPGIIPLTSVVSIFLVGYFIRKQRLGWAFIMNSLAIATSVITLFLVLYPRVMISSLNPVWSLTIYNASSTPYTLTVMTVVALCFVPVVLIYQGWSYWVFRKRIENKPEALTY